MESFIFWMIVLSVSIVALQLFKYIHRRSAEKESTSTEQTKDVIEKSKAFKSFQIAFVSIFLLAFFADWVLGAYQYELYKEYLKHEHIITKLYIAAFAFQAISCLFMGSLADVFGRKKMCLLFCIIYATSSVLKHTNNYYILLLSAMISGVSDSILLSCFEAWMITEHHHLGFNADLLSSTFEIAWGLNSIVAIISGFVGFGVLKIYEHIKQNHGHSDAWITAPQLAGFDLSVVCLIILFFLILKFWKHENYGDSTPKVMFLCVLQSSFESSLFIMVTKWDNVLCGTTVDGECKRKINAGMLFVVFMMSCLLGTSMDAVAGMYKWYNAEIMAAFVSLLSSISFIGISKKFDYEWNLLCFVVFEICTGVYWPIICGLRERYIKDEVRATVTNLFRLPINIIVIVVLLNVERLGDHIFTLLSGLCAIGMLCALKLAYDNHQKKKIENPEQGEDKSGDAGRDAADTTC